jgi:photosystem II stability/assembly factor-like uncharacterized protein
MKTNLLLLVIAIFCVHPASGQVETSKEPLYVRMMNDTSVHNFYDIQQEFNRYFEARDKGRGSGYVQFRRYAHMVESAYYPSGEMFNIAAKIIAEYLDYTGNFDNTLLPPSYEPGNWTSMGPSNHSQGNGWNGGIGRVNCIAFHPSNANIYWAGTPSGGLWKYSGGWQPLTDGFPSIGISGIAVDPSNVNHIYILTGDGDGCNTYSTGVLETSDGGETWQTTGLSFTVPTGVRGYKLLMHPTNHDILFCVSNAGVFKTTNGGDTWTNVLGVIAKDIEFKPGSPATMYVASLQDFYRSTDNGDTWTQVFAGLPNDFDPVRIGIGVTPADASVIYLIIGQSSEENTRSGFKGCYLSTNSGESFTLQSNSPNIFGYPTDGSDFKEQASYDLAVAVSRTDADELHFGGINCWKSTDAGLTWSHTSYWKENISGEEYTHADIHALEFNPLNNFLFCGSDGGVYRSTDHAANWTDLSAGLVNTQCYRMGGTPQNVNLIACGTQDNGGNTFQGGSVNKFIHDIGADGFESMIEPADSVIRYESTYGSLYRTTSDGAFWTEITPEFVNDDIWDVAWIMHPTTPTTLFLGHDNIWKSTNRGTSWMELNTGNSTGKKFRHIAHGVNNLSRIYGLTTLGVFMTNDGGSSWTNVTAGLPVDSCELSCIAVDPDASTHVLVTCFGYVSGLKVFESTNAGTTWTNISGTLPNVQARCVVFEVGSNNGYYAGTDIGVFYRNNSTNGWVPFLNGLPNTIVSEMEINYNKGELVAATFGRGFWKTRLYGHCPEVYVLTPANNPGTSSSQYYAASDSITSTRFVYGSYNSTITYRGGNTVTLLPGFEAESGSVFEATIGDCPSNGLSPSRPWTLSHHTTGLLMPAKGMKK